MFNIPEVQQILMRTKVDESVSYHVFIELWVWGHDVGLQTGASQVGQDLTLARRCTRMVEQNRRSTLQNTEHRTCDQNLPIIHHYCSIL